MFSRQFKRGYFVLEGLNSFGTVLFFYYFYFFMQKEYGYGTKANLALAALNGGAYAAASWFAGRAAQRLGYISALMIGFGMMGISLGLGWLADSAAAHIVLMVGTVLGMCFTWPVLEALVSEGERPEDVPHMVGIYNVVWAATGAVSYFIGGTLVDTLGLRVVFAVPMFISIIQFALAFWLKRMASKEERSRARAGASHPAAVGSPQAGASDAHAQARATGGGTLHVRRHPPRAPVFLKMAWLANPFAYIGINTLIAVIPSVAANLQLSTRMAGFYCSIWLFARLAVFVVLWGWTAWHYKFSWLFGAFAALAASFVVMLLVPNLYALALAQVLFGAAVGLIYYSSLFYSMDLSESKSEHGGLHEAAIGVGNFAGPALGAVSLHFLPQHAQSGAISVSMLLFCGLAGLVAIWKSDVS